MDTTLFLILLALVLFFLEIFAPGGILAGIGIVLLTVASLLITLDYGLLAGFLMFVGTGLIAVTLFFVEVKLFEKSPLLRFLSVKERQESHTRNEPGRESLVGETGRTVTPLSPLGKVEIGGTLHEASTEGEPLAAETPVEVARVTAFYLIVQPSTKA